MDRISSRCAASLAHALCCMMIAVAVPSCGDPAPSDAADGARMHSDSVADASTGPSTDTPADVVPDMEAATPAADAGVVNPVSQRDAVDANGVRGALVETPFLADMGEGRQNLMLVDWEVPAGKEVYLCGRITVPDDVYFNEFYPVNPAGTHHTAMSASEAPNAPDGVSLCDVSEIGRRSIGGSGVGTSGGKLPEGMAMKADRGSQLILNLHLFNTTDAPLRGRSGSLVTTVPASQVTTIVDGMVATTTKLIVPPGKSVQNTVCTMQNDYTLMSVFPHMHEMGRYIKVVAKRAAGDAQVLFDGPYDFAHQLAYRIDPPLQMAMGDRIEVACTYDNTTGKELHFGESSKDEMCVAGFLRFPAVGRSTCSF